MSERIYKLQPDRTVHLRGFDTFAAAAAIHSATATGFKVSGTFRDPADFTVAVLYDADNFFEHPSIRYLPDFDFTGLTLSFNLRYSKGLQPIDSPKYNWIDWATLDCIRQDGTTAKIPLWDHATLAGESFDAASATLTVLGDPDTIHAGDRLSLWYQNIAFDYTVPASRPSIEFAFFAHGTGTEHFISIGPRTYTHIESNPLGESSGDQANALVALINGAPDADVSAAIGSDPWVVRLTVLDSSTGAAISLDASDDNASAVLTRITPAWVAAKIATLVNHADWSGANSTHALMASTAGPVVTVSAARYGFVDVAGSTVTFSNGAKFPGLIAGSAIRIDGELYEVATLDSPTQLTLTETAPDVTGAPYVAPRGGHDGNLIELVTLGTATLGFDHAHVSLTGGNSAVTWNCAIDFSALDIASIRQCWLTLAPALVSSDLEATEWEASFTAWSLSGPESTQMLQIAGPGSVRVEENDAACAYTGAWAVESGFYSKYFARATSAGSVTIRYECQFTHDLWIGTSLYSDRSAVSVALDGVAKPDLNCYLDAVSAVVTRRRICTDVPPGQHVVTLTAGGGGIFYFDFLEAAVPSDLPAPLTARPGISPALDFDTDHTYKVSPARLLWSFDQLGYAGPINEYLGVFWWNERTCIGGFRSAAQIDFSGTLMPGDDIFITLNGVTIGKTIFPGDTLTTIARHFSAYINGAFVGARAESAGSQLTIFGRSPAPAYNLSVAVTSDYATLSAAPLPATYGIWQIDPEITPPLNLAAREWHADFYAQCASRSREVVTACSMELVNPPSEFTARYANDAPVATATGFGALTSNHCAIGSTALLSYQKGVYRAIADLQAAAGLTPCVQYGEFLWWYFAGDGMAFYDAETAAAATSSLGRPLHFFTSPDDDPAVNAYADANFLADRLRDHLAELVSDIRAAYPDVICELLWPYDVNYPTPVPVAAPTLGGQLNRFVNLPAEWQTKAGSGFDRVKVEALAFASSLRDLNLAKQAIHIFPDFGWPKDSIRYLIPVFGSATPWNRELALASENSLPINNLWAWDHICLFNLDVPERNVERWSGLKAA